MSDGFDLFEMMEEKHKENEAPLPAKMRPRTLDEIVGQEHILGKDKLLYRAIKADKLTSIVLYGPPGTGKTTLAKVIANTTKSNFKQINATVSSKKEMEEIVDYAKKELSLYGRKTILFIDEIHRFNKAQQDYLLPFVEDGLITLIGATTENPYFEVNNALLSRSTIFELKPLSADNLKELIVVAVYDKERGLGELGLDIDDDAISFLADIADGDARAALKAVELASLTTERSDDGLIHITLEVAEECIQKKYIRYDKNGDNHYDCASAFIESMRNSDPDAALYYLARMLSAGEDIKFIARRICIFASEDIGLADSNALNVATSAFLAIERIGMPEATLILAHAAAYMACAPKCNTTTAAIGKAMGLVNSLGNIPIPKMLQDCSYKGAEKLGRGVGLLDAHQFENHYANQNCLPEAIKDEKLFNLQGIGDEKRIIEYFKNIKQLKNTREE